MQCARPYTLRNHSQMKQWRQRYDAIRILTIVFVYKSWRLIGLNFKIGVVFNSFTDQSFTCSTPLAISSQLRHAKVTTVYIYIYDLTLTHAYTSKCFTAVPEVKFPWKLIQLCQQIHHMQAMLISEGFFAIKTNFIENSEPLFFLKMEHYNFHCLVRH